MAVLNSSLAGALGRPDLVFAAQGRTASVGGPPVVMGGTGGAAVSGGSGPLGAASGQGAALFLLTALGLYVAFAWWVRPHLK